MTSFRDLLAKIGDSHLPHMRFGGATAEEFLTWQQQFAAKLEELSGSLVPFRRRSRVQPPVSRRVEILDRIEMPDHYREHVVIESVLGTQVPAFVLVPKTAAGRRCPGLLALHGHTATGKAAVAGVAPGSQPGQSDYGLAAVRAGFVALCPDWWGWGERAESEFDFEGQDICNTKFVASAMYGLPLLSLMINDAQAAMDALMARPDVDAARVGVAGNSFGGRMSMYLAALDERARFAVCSGCLNCFRERSLSLTSCGAQFFPGMLQWGDVQDVFSLIAPRPLMIMTGRADPLLPTEWVARMKPVIQRAYEVLGATGNLAFFDHDDGHVLPQEPMVDWIKRQCGVA